MKWYFAINEAGTRGDVGLHTRLAILSAKKHTNLEPILLYMGESNEFTKWAEAHGVRVIPSEPSFLPTFIEMAKENKYPMGAVGHWLRSNVCLLEKQDEFALYTDIDVLFLQQPALNLLRPKYFAAAPEFDKSLWNYFNSGVMLMNIPELLGEYNEFEKFVIAGIKERGLSFRDQLAYNQFYRGRWDKLPLEMNWKPYWGPNKEATIVHFHGPKIGNTMRSIIDNKWNWNTNHGRQIGSLFLGFLDSYLESFKAVQEYIALLPSEQADHLDRLFSDISKYDREQHKNNINLDFMKYRMFNEEAIS